MFEYASAFQQDLSTWDFSGKKFAQAFDGVQMPAEYYPVGCVDSACRGY
jgi:hypothetical protein